MITDERLAELIEYMLDDPGAHGPLVHSHAASDILSGLHELQEWRKPHARAARGEFPFDRTSESGIAK